MSQLGFGTLFATPETEKYQSPSQGTVRGSWPGLKLRLQCFIKFKFGMVETRAEPDISTSPCLMVRWWEKRNMANMMQSSQGYTVIWPSPNYRTSITLEPDFADKWNIEKTPQTNTATMAFGRSKPTPAIRPKMPWSCRTKKESISRASHDAEFVGSIRIIVQIHIECSLQTQPIRNIWLFGINMSLILVNPP